MKTLSIEHRKKLSLAKKNKPWSGRRIAMEKIKFQKTHIRKVCIQCEVVFYPFISEVERGNVRFCSRKCHGLFIKNKALSTSHRSKISKAKLGVKFSDAHRQSMREAYSSGRFTSYLLGKKLPKEWREKIAEGKRGEKNPNWNNGVSFLPYPITFNSVLKKKVKERDSYICQRCGKNEEEEKETAGKALAVHHVNYDKMNCDVSNLATLCNSCNSIVNFNREHWTNYFQEKICQ